MYLLVYIININVFYFNNNLIIQIFFFVIFYTTITLPAIWHLPNATNKANHNGKLYNNKNKISNAIKAVISINNSNTYVISKLIFIIIK